MFVFSIKKNKGQRILTLDATEYHMFETDLDPVKVDISVPDMTEYDGAIRGDQKIAFFDDVIKQRSLILCIAILRENNKM